MINEIYDLVHQADFLLSIFLSYVKGRKNTTLHKYYGKQPIICVFHFLLVSEYI